MASDRYMLKLAQVGQINSVDTMTSQKQAVADLNTRTFCGRCTDGGTAATNYTETAFVQVQRQGTVKNIVVTAPIAVTANASNFVTFTVSKRTGAGAAVTLGTFATSGATSLAAFVPQALTLTLANCTLAAGDVLTVTATKSGTGVAIAAATSDASVTVDVEEGTV